MCEPYHSIVQYPERDKDDNDHGPKITGLGQRQSLGSKALDFMKKIKSWFHFSKMGSGHSEAIRANRTTELWLPPDTRYEVAWWNRSVKRDGKYTGHEFDAAEALNSCRAVREVGLHRRPRSTQEISTGLDGEDRTAPTVPRAVPRNLELSR